eukprot:475358-Prorocentrum_minimum.AAC.3
MSQICREKVEYRQFYQCSIPFRTDEKSLGGGLVCILLFSGRRGYLRVANFRIEMQLSCAASRGALFVRDAVAPPKGNADVWARVVSTQGVCRKLRFGLGGKSTSVQIHSRSVDTSVYAAVSRGKAADKATDKGGKRQIKPRYVRCHDDSDSSKSYQNFAMAQQTQRSCHADPSGPGAQQVSAV